MPFRLLSAAEEWFRYLKSDFADLSTSPAPLFEMYYLCLMAGLARNQKNTITVQTSDTRELVDYYPGHFKECGRLITAMFLSNEILELGIDLAERESLHREIHKLVDPLQPNQLSDLGQDEINRYSYGGFEVLQDMFGSEPPRQMETFLPLYKRYLDEALSANST